MTLDVFIRQENISLYKKLLSDRNVADGQRDVIGKLLADEEAKLLDLSVRQGKRKRRVQTARVLAHPPGRQF
jgi:hypothetical protein